jgi:hypothetical protein
MYDKVTGLIDNVSAAASSSPTQEHMIWGCNAVAAKFVHTRHTNISGC